VQSLSQFTTLNLLPPVGAFINILLYPVAGSELKETLPHKAVKQAAQYF
jgi:hypothetical protein